MMFTNKLREENDDIFQMIFHHPFVQGIGIGEISHQSLAHYVKGDFEYLNAFMRIYGIAIAKSKRREDISYFFNRIYFILNDEAHPHHNFCNYLGLKYVDLQGYSLPPTADHYVKHMLYHAQLGTSGELLGVLLPCPWTYFEIGQELMKQYKPTSNHPFYEWITFYASPSSETMTANMRNRLDQLAEKASNEELNKISEAFRKSCQLEFKFWEMAYRCEEWPGK
ncbi:thiaminase II [Virgibacillus proomii]|uniref:thiaminase II n=1 Tax=Virgibacillus proomii TaxID=84407 RepID=UPI000987585F|nr:thiaminase II [Virgibacillus proomii]